MSGSIPTSSISFLGIVNAYNNVNTTDLPTTNISLSSFRSKTFSDSKQSNTVLVAQGDGKIIITKV